jgi:diacylglycerol kinase family enzyme
MRVTLIHNPRAGVGEPSKAALLSALREAGHEVRYHTSTDRAVARALRDPGDVVVVAGGDGTVGAVALRHAERDIPVAILPLGTANNVARALGADVPWRDAVAGIASAARRRLDVGVARSPWGTREFLESAGAGLLAELLLDAERRDADPDSASGTDAIDAGRRRLLAVLDRAEPRWYTIDADGADLSGEFVMVEAMSLPAVGSRVPLAPDARPDDGLLQLVRVAADERDALRAWLDALRAGDAGAPPVRAPPVRVQPARSVRLSSTGALAHVDDAPWVTAERSDAARTLRVALRMEVVAGESAPLTVLVPR